MATRREFVRTLIAGGAGLAVVPLAGCGDDSGGSDSGAGGDSGGGICDTETVIVENHNHELVVSQADIAAGVEKTYDIQGSSPHTHSVTLSADDFTKLGNGQTVMTTSTSTGHTHDVVVRCK